MKKLLISLLSLTTILSASAATLTQTNNNHISTIQNINSNKVVIDNINKRMSVTAKPGNDVTFDKYDEERILDLPWKEAQTITSGVVSNYFKHSLPKGEIVNTKLNLNLTEEQTPNSVALAGMLAEFDNFLSQSSIIYTWINISQDRKNPNLTKAHFIIIVHAENQESSEPCSASCFIDKITLN